MILVITGCKKDVKPVSETTTATTVQNTSIPKGYIMTPAGLMKAENVHRIEKGESIFLENGHAFRTRIGTRVKLEDLGEVRPFTLLHKNPRGLWFAGIDSGANDRSNTAPSGGASGNNWVTYGEAVFTLPIQSFSTNWTVPNNPTGNTGQLIYIWSGISTNASTPPLIQPVLQWGSNFNGTNQGWGGQFWSLTNWCILGPTTSAFMAPAQNIPVGTNLQGVVNVTGFQPDGSFNYSCFFAGYAAQTLTVVEGGGYNTLEGAAGNYPTMPGITHAFEVLEVPGLVNDPSQYPNQPLVTMNNIQIYTGNTMPINYPTVTWTTPFTGGASMQEHTQAFPNIFGANGGEVDLWFGAGTKFLNAARTQNFYRNNCGTGSTGSQVPYTVYYGKYGSLISQADADNQAQNDINANGQNYANANGVCNTGTPISVSVSHSAPTSGYIPSVNFLDPTTGNNIAFKSFTSSSGTIFVPPGTYNVVMTQTNNHSFSATITGYGTHSGTTVTFNNVVVPSGTFMGNISIVNP